ncbi:peptide chain release factor N(5)-glutamine methyltransferase [Ciceribacter sp. L1K22]|uniref:peptide chain release factor N(5)-glutamine methyltransferase n=1 Tax=Ciceribacter sp. L1K22 TaxID=2820275 RepID=UPI001ABEDB49|nr:peptide chain release factor N(5)-glutamine methyltransferase [Ciceribacter sp. L1K22]MBO3762343.1 peptide chain release factor N(5)-glutamine methyltransferase [Ciceribacter sp. L1K22]
MSGETVGDLLRLARREFQAADLDDPALEARILVSGLLDLSTTEMVLADDRAVAPDDAERVREGIFRRLAHEPVYRILGHRAFHGLDLKISAATLDPRPDTEVLVDRVLHHMRALVEQRGRVRILDLGTGTGAIGLSLAKASPAAEVVLTDISAEALSTAEENAHINGIADRTRFVRSDWFGAVSGSFDIIVSNPPYIVREVIGTLDPEVRNYDPMAALDGGADGLDAYRAIAAGALSHLAEDGFVGLEIGYDQNEAVTALFASEGFGLIEAAKDFGGRDRVLILAPGV